MGHQSNDARKALLAYARDLHSTAGRGGFVSPVGTSKRDDAPNQFLGSGAPHQLAIAAAVVCVVLLGGIGLATATNSADAPKTGPTQPASVQVEGTSARLINAERMSTPNAIRALHDLGLSRAADALDTAAGAGIDSSPAVLRAIQRIFDITDVRLDSAQQVRETEVIMALAIADLEAATRPRGLDIAQVRSGRENLSPGLNIVWLEQVRKRSTIASTENPTLIPPGQIKAKKPNTARDSAPGQAKEKPEKGGGKP
jgi:hypothetical protein